MGRANYQKKTKTKFKNFEGNYKGKTLGGKAKEFVKTAGKQQVRGVKKIIKKIKGKKWDKTE